jgi:hypothetical protein
MAVPIPGTRPRILPGGQTGSQRAAGFVRVNVKGTSELVAALLRAASSTGSNGIRPLTDAAKKAAKKIGDEYSSQVSKVTGNLARSVRVRDGKKKYAGNGIAVVGPVHVVDSEKWDIEKKGAGNHAWLGEFGTGARRPATQGRRTFLYVHEKINGRFNRVPNEGRPFDNEQFERMGRGFYFLMGSKNVSQRSQGKGAFVPDGKGGTRPYFLAPNETYPAMPAAHWMEKSIQQAGPAALNTLMNALKAQIDRISKGGS